MNNKCDLYLRYLGKCNLHREVMELRKQKQHSQNFEEIINWLRDLINLCEGPETDQVTAKMLIKSGDAIVQITAKVTSDDCRIYKWEWPDNMVG